MIDEGICTFSLVEPPTASKTVVPLHAMMHATALYVGSLEHSLFARLLEMRRMYVADNATSARLPPVMIKLNPLLFAGIYANICSFFCVAEIFQKRIEILSPFDV